MAENNLIGVVTVTFNSAEVLPDFLRCMIFQTHGDFILFAVDNASTDNTLGMLHDLADDRLHIIANGDNRGFAEGSNQGIRAAMKAGCSSVLILNNDTEFDASLLAGLYEGLTSHNVDMTCPKMMFHNQPDRIWAAGGGFQPWAGYRSVHYGERELDVGRYDKPRFVKFAPGCCVLIRTSVFESNGLFDKRYFVYAEDTDFMYRAMRAGHKLLYLPNVRLLHKVSSLTGGEDSQFATRFGTRNRLFFLLKHFGLVRTLPWIILCQIEWFLRSFDKQLGSKWLRIKRDAMRESLQMWKSDN